MNLRRCVLNPEPVGQSRFRIWFPPPQVFVQSPQLFQFSQSHSVLVRSRQAIILCNLSVHSCNTKCKPNCNHTCKHAILAENARIVHALSCKKLTWSTLFVHTWLPVFEWFVTTSAAVLRTLTVLADAVTLPLSLSFATCHRAITP